MKYRVVIEPDENGTFVAMCPALLGCTAQGKTRAEALTNIETAMTTYLANLNAPAPQPGQKIIENHA